jgi:hypothetical protein
MIKTRIYSAPFILIILASTLLTFTSVSCCSTHGSDPDFSAIESGFKNIPDTVLTSVYWYWLSDNLSKEGVIKDLEAMKRAGINRAFIGNIGLNDLPFGKVKIFTPEWWDILHAALKRATELNIQIGIFNSPGWSQSGGPWIKPERSMRWLNSSELLIEGPQKIHMKLDPPCSDFQRERVIAYPAPSGYGLKMADLKPQYTSIPSRSDLENIFDADTSTIILLHNKESLTLDISFPRADTVRSIVLRMASIPVKASASFSAKSDGGFRDLKHFEIDRSNPGLTVGFDPYAPIVVTLPETAGKDFRIEFTGGYPSGGIADILITSQALLERYPEKTLAKMFQTPHPMWHDYMWDKQPEASGDNLAIDPHKVLDLTASFGADGYLNWDVPQGSWVLMQTGMTSTGVINEPATPEGTGLEADKMSREHIAFHFDAFLGEILKRIPPEDRKCWKVVVEDSYERGGQNWTDGFINSFRSVYSYDPVPYLPVLKGYVVGSREISDRFLWDLRRLVADRVAKDYVGGLREVSHAHGLTTWLENYGHWGFPAEFLQYGGQSDEVGGEFWSEGDLGDIENRAASSCAHIYGKRKVSAESFTCAGEPFSRFPAKLKQRGDRFFAEGINNTLMHVYIVQPGDTPPGVNAWFGNEFNRLNTWFDGMKYFTSYLKRTNFMLQQGQYVADAAYFIGEDVPKMTGICDPPLPAGYSFDYINSEVIMNRLSVKNGRFVLPEGISYKILVLPRLQTMRPALLKKLTELVNQGGEILGPAPVSSPGLSGYPECDNEVRKLAHELWGPVDGVQVKSRKAGKGTVMSGMSMEEAFRACGLIPDLNTAPDTPVKYLHRQLEDGDIYFITNQSDKRIKISPEFRLTGKVPELWDPVTGNIRFLQKFSTGKSTTMVPLRLEPSESIFIVFRKKTDRDIGSPVRSNYPEQKIIATLKGPWSVTFDHAMRGPAKPVVFDTLCDWTLMKNDSIRYFSGKAVCKTEFSLDKDNMGRRLFIGFAPVNGVAVVRVNGKEAGGVWTAPWQADISSLAVEGNNTVEVEIMNTWVNRLIGDSKLPQGERKTWCFVNPYKPDSKLIPAGLKGPVRIFYTLY